MVVDQAGVPVAASSGDAVARGRRWPTGAGSRRISPAPRPMSARRWSAASSDEVVFTYSRVLRRPDGALDGALQVADPHAYFEQPGLAAEFRPGTVLGLFDMDGRVLAMTGLAPACSAATPAPAPRWPRSPPATEGILRGMSPFGGGERVTAFRHVSDWPVFVTASVPLDEVLAPWRRSVRWSIELIGSVGAGLLLLAAQAVRMSDREVRMRSELAAANAALRRGRGGARGAGRRAHPRPGRQRDALPRHLRQHLPADRAADAGGHGAGGERDRARASAGWRARRWSAGSSGRRPGGMTARRRRRG